MLYSPARTLTEEAVYKQVECKPEDQAVQSILLPVQPSPCLQSLAGDCMHDCLILFLSLFA